jgi:hypothetical protein
VGESGNKKLLVCEWVTGYTTVGVLTRI